MDIQLLHAYGEIKKKYNIAFDLKDEQVTLLKATLCKQDAVGFLPTGFGKSIPLLLDEIHPDERHTVLVISSLLSLMKDQVDILHRKGISAAYLTSKKDMDEDTIRGIENAEYSVIFASPELAISRRWIRVFREEIWQRRACLLAVDECHCISEWGESFRPEYRQLSILRSVFETPCIALTATVTKKVKEDVIKYLSIPTDHICVAVVPDRPNIFLAKKKCTHHFETELSWVPTYLKEKKEDAKKMIIYCRSIPAVSDIYLFISDSLGADRKVFRDNCEFSIIDMYHASSSESCQRKVVNEFKREDSKIRCLVATVAFGMGVDIPDIECVIHWGAPKSPLSYWQEVGRCGRDGRKAIAVMYPYGYSLNPKRTDESVIKMCKEDMCLRKCVLDNFVVEGMLVVKKNVCIGCNGECVCEFCKCCCVCMSECACEMKKTFF